MYGVIAEKEAVAGTSAGYLIAHSAYTYVIDPEGVSVCCSPLACRPRKWLMTSSSFLRS